METEQNIGRFLPRDWRLAHGRQITLGPTGHIMAIINVTPDSFSDGGAYFDPDAAIGHALSCVREGATILDIGGESTRPGAAAVSPDIEQARVLPVVKRLAHETQALLSVDTYHASTAAAAIQAGAHIINDVSGLTHDPSIATIVAATGAGLCVMHTGRNRRKLQDPFDDQRFFFQSALAVAREAGVQDDQITLDPGFGFEKTDEEHLVLLDRLAELLDLGYPLLVGTSRKRFLGTLTGRAVEHRDTATAVTTALLRQAGAAIVRVHDVPDSRDALSVVDAMIAARAKMLGPCD